MTREAYDKMIREDLAWLEKQPRTLEREHIILIVKHSADHEYLHTPVVEAARNFVRDDDFLRLKSFDALERAVDQLPPWALPRRSR